MYLVQVVQVFFISNQLLEYLAYNIIYVLACDDFSKHHRNEENSKSFPLIYDLTYMI